jgi:hypothetical protein
MKNYILLVLPFFSLTIFAQEGGSKNSVSFEQGEGFTFNLNNGDYQFNLGGFIQPSINLNRPEGEGSKMESQLNVRRSFFIIGGKAVKQKVSFLVQTDFNASNPLMDAWVAYHPYSWLTITGGQKQNFVNNREMLYREDRLQFTDRSLSSQTFSRTGREFGLFVETKFGEKIGIAPKFSVTSGDGRNSFGADSRDVDYGGVKFGGRLDLYPLGYFTPGNDLYTADLQHEEKLKLLIGSAASRNFGASNAVGEGHGNFFVYNIDGKIQLPNYNKIVADILMKYKGFSMLLEYTNTTATGLDLIFLEETAETILAPTQISEFLILGNSFTGQFGYVTKSGLGFDLRYDQATPEFGQNSNSLLSEFNSYTFGLSKYFNENNLKIQAAISQINVPQGRSSLNGSLLFQIGF